MRARLLAMCAAALCMAFVAVRDDDAGTPIVWPTPPVTFVIQQNGSDDVSDGSDLTAIRDALAVWGQPGCTSFAYADGGLVTTAQTEAALSGNDSVNRLGFLESSWVAGADGAIGLAIRRRTVSTGVDVWIDVDILMNGVDATWATDGGADNQDIQSVAAHELGHALGLQHSPHPQATMYFRGTRGTAAARSLAADDIAAICYLYPTGSFSCAVDAECPLLHDAFETHPSLRTVCTAGNCISGQVDYGEACFTNGQCASGACLQGLDTSPAYNAGFCTESCTAGTCSSGEWCEAGSGYCLLGYDDCAVDADCSGANLYCVMDKDLRFRCRETCLDDGHCNSGDVCDSIRTPSGVGFCRTPGGGAGGDSCESGLECASLSCSAAGIDPTCRDWCESQADDTACTDGNSCTSGETCQAGSCGNPTSTETCPAPNGCTNTGSCDPSDGSCTFTYNTDPCDDDDGCTENDTCGGGSCAGSVRDCSDGDACTSDGCAADTCTNTPIAGCCNDAGDCDDSDACTTNTCSGAGGSCSFSIIGGCCNDAGDCDDADLCTTNSCSGPGGTCSFAPISNCCDDVADCDDSNDCTADDCNLGTNRCEHTPVPSCCTSPADCDDSDDCTTDTCNTGTGECSSAAVPDCCASAGDCDDGEDCTIDTCPVDRCDHAPAPWCADGGSDDGGASDGGPPGDPAQNGDPTAPGDPTAAGDVPGDPMSPGDPATAGDPATISGDASTHGDASRPALPGGLHLAGNCACSTRSQPSLGWLLTLAGAIVGVRRKGRRTRQ